MAARTATPSQVRKGTRAGDGGRVTHKPAPKPAAPKARQPVSPATPPARMIDGQAVVSDEPVLSNMSPGGRQIPLKIRRLTLADGSVRFSCAEADCEFIGSSRGEVQGHRMSEHPGKKATGKAARLDPVVDAAAMAMTLSELIELARSAARWGDMVDALQAQADAERRRADAAEAQLRKVNAALARIGFKPDEGKDDS